MKPFIFRFRNGKAVVTSAGLSFTPALRDRTLRRRRWARPDVASIAVQPLSKRRCDLILTHRNGETRRFPDIDGPAAEMEEELAIHGYRRGGCPVTVARQLPANRLRDFSLAIFRLRK